MQYQSFKSSNAKVVKQRSSPEILRVSPSRQLSEYNDDTFVAYLRSSLFVVSISDGASANTLTDTWPGFLVRQQHQPLASQCLVSLSQAYFGIQHGAQDIAVRGTSLYVHSLGRLNASLSDAHARNTDDTLLSVMVLFLYEMLVLSSNNAWIEHALGLGRLIESRGPRSFIEPVQRTLFESNRFIIILASLAANKPTFLSRQEWKTQPWAKRPSEKNRLHHLLDLFADLATLKAQTLNYGEDTPMVPIASTIEQKIHELRHWRAAWDAEILLNVAEIPNQCARSRAVLPTVLHFPSMYTANTVCLYDAIFIQAVRLLNITTDGTFHEYYVQAQHAATEICQATQYQMQNTDQMTGQFFLLFPLRMAYLALESSGSPLRWWVEETLHAFASSRKTWGVTRKLNEYGGTGRRAGTEG